MKKILGLDIGTNSIGWAIVSKDDNGEFISGVNNIKTGVRIIPMDTNILTRFEQGKSIGVDEKGNAISEAAQRRQKRGQRRINFRYKLRKQKLEKVLDLLGMLPDKDGILYSPSTERKSNINLKLELFKLRATAATGRIELHELGRILIHLNQLRGYFENTNEIEKDESGNYTATPILIEERGTVTLKKTKEEIKEYFIRFDNNIEGKTYKQGFKVGEPADFKIKEAKDKQTGETSLKIEYQPKPTNWQKNRKYISSEIKNSGYTVGQYFYSELLKDPYFQTRRKTIDRDRFIDEFNTIWKEQVKHHPILRQANLVEIVPQVFPKNPPTDKKIFTDGLGYFIRECIIYYQRGWQQETDRAGCTFEKYPGKDKNGNLEIKKRPVCQRSHPDFMEFKIWDKIHSVRIIDSDRIERELTHDEKLKVFEILTNQKSLEPSSLLNKLKISEKGTRTNYHIVKYGKEAKEISLSGNSTFVTIKKLFSDNKFKEVFETYFFPYWQEKKSKNSNSNYKNYIELWQLLVDETISSEIEFEKAFETKFEHISELKGNALIKRELLALKNKGFKDAEGYASFSTRAVNKLLPFLRIGDFWKLENLPSQKTIQSHINKIVNKEKLDFIDPKDKKAILKLSTISDYYSFYGLSYWEAAYICYGKHSEAGFGDGEMNPEDLSPVKRNSMNNPIVEQVVNETIALVKAISKEFGKPDEIMIELAREMKAKMDDRRKMFESSLYGNKRNEIIREKIVEMGEQPTSSNVDRMKVWRDQMEDEPELKIRANQQDIERYKAWLEQDRISPYTGNTISFSDLFNRKKTEVDHIIPKSRFFDDSLNNRVVCEAAVNSAKDGQTAWELITQGPKKYLDPKYKILEPEEYKARIEFHIKNEKKKTNLLRKGIPEDFVQRQLKETQYINVTLRRELTKICKPENVNTTTGGITDMLREQWLKWRENKEVTIDGQTAYQKEHNVLQELIKPRFENFQTKKGLPVIQEKIKEVRKRNDFIELVAYDYIEGFSKRLDHRHHALDALMIACTNRGHIHILNNLNQEVEGRDEMIEKLSLDGKSKRKFKKPWEDFTKDAMQALSQVIISHKGTNYLTSPSKHTNEQASKGNQKKPLAIRGSLHDETLYGKITRLERRFIELEAAAEYLKHNISIEAKPSDLILDISDITGRLILKPKYYKILKEWIDLNAKDKKGNYIKQEKFIELLRQNPIKYDGDKPLNFVTIKTEAFAYRPNGIIGEDFDKKLNSVSDPKTARILKYRKNKLGKEAFKNLTEFPIIQNAIYEVQLDENSIWYEVDSSFDENKIKKVRKPQHRELILSRLKEFNNNPIEAFVDIFRNPIVIPIKDNRKIEITKVRLIDDRKKMQIEPNEKRNRNNEKLYVNTGNNYAFVVYEQQDNSKNRKFDVISFFNAVKMKTGPEGNLLKRTEDFAEKIEGYNIAFTLAKNELVYVPEKGENMNEIPWDNPSLLFNKIYKVAKFSQEKGGSVKLDVEYQSKAHEISVELEKKENEEKGKKIIEDEYTQTAPSGVSLKQVCIKVYMNPLGTKVYPYWSYDIFKKESIKK